MQSRGAPVITEAQIQAGLAAVGLRGGDTVVVHSSLRSFGWVDGGADAVIDALIAAVGPAGTVCFPTLSYGPYHPANPPPLFDPQETPSIVGHIPERFRRRPGVMRSLHPTHSVAAIGAAADALLRDHDASPTPCGPDSPWGRIARADGRILMIGTGTGPCTMFHGPEEVAEPDVRCTPPTPCRIRTPGGVRTAWLRLHGPYRGAVSDRAALEPELEAEGILTRAQVGGSTLLLLRARELWDFSLRRLRAQPGTKLPSK